MNFLAYLNAWRFRLALSLNVQKKFFYGMVPILNALADYVEQWNADQSLLLEKKWHVEKMLYTKPYPEWVYKVGFNPGLRAGFRFFLVKLDEVIEIAFTLCLLSQRISRLTQFKTDELQAILAAISVAMTTQVELLRGLASYFEKEKINETSLELTNDISTLEEILRDIVPHQLELLDLSPDYLTLTTFVRDIKDMRELLLQLLAALPKE